jgi:hypothetical protein
VGRHVKCLNRSGSGDLVAYAFEWMTPVACRHTSRSRDGLWAALQKTQACGRPRGTRYEQNIDEVPDFTGELTCLSSDFGHDIPEVRAPSLRPSKCASSLEITVTSSRG